MMEDLTDQECAEQLYDWRAPWNARPSQVAPLGDWRYWLIRTGRGWGKTRTGAEWVREQVEEFGRTRIALVGATSADVRDTMIEGPAGILSICPPWNRPEYEPSKRRLTWPNGAMAIAYSADEPDRLRGPQHDAAWCDETATWRRMMEAWDMLMFGLRMGQNPQALVTTTPRPCKLLKQLIDDPLCVVTGGSTLENVANLAPQYVQKIIERYQGTRLGRQEIDGELLEDIEGALWTRRMIEAHRTNGEGVPEYIRVVVAIDPAVTSGEDADDTGIVVAALGTDREAYILHDATCHKPPAQWAQRAVNCYENFRADRIIGEVNNGGDLVETVIRTADPTVAYRKVHASRGKRVRAEPIAALYEQGRVHHVGALDALEDQMCNFVPDHMDGSPDRVDALVWALTELMVSPAPAQATIQLVDPVRI